MPGYCNALLGNHEEGQRIQEAKVIGLILGELGSLVVALVYLQYLSVVMSKDTEQGAGEAWAALPERLENGYQLVAQCHPGRPER